MLPYPPWFTGDDRLRIEHVWAEVGGPVGFSRRYRSEAAVIAAIARVFQVVVQVLERHRLHHEPKALMAAADQLRGAAIEEAWAWGGPIRSSADTFIAAVCEAAPMPSWLSTGPDQQLPAGAAIAVDERVPVNLAEAAERIGISVATVRRRVADGSLRASRLGKIIRIPQAEIERLSTGTGQYAPENRPTRKTRTHTATRKLSKRT